MQHKMGSVFQDHKFFTLNFLFFFALFVAGVCESSFGCVYQMFSLEENVLFEMVEFKWKSEQAKLEFVIWQFI